MTAFETGAYYYPLTTQCDVRQERARNLGRPVIDETELAASAAPLFEGHDQPIHYTTDGQSTRWDDSDPASMSTQIDLAQDAGLDFFIFDSYEGTKNGKPLRESHRPLELFRELVLRKTMKYAKMQTLAGPRVVLPVSTDPSFQEPDRTYDVNKESAQYIVDTMAHEDWSHPNYLHIDGRPYTSFFMPDMTPGWDGTPEALRVFIGEIRDYAHKKYKINPYLVGSVRKLTQAQEMTNAGVDALTGYAFLPHFGDDTPPIQDYSTLLRERKDEWREISIVNTFVPPAVVGWDASPRGKSVYRMGEAKGHGYAPIVTGGSATQFEAMLRDTTAFTTTNVPKVEQYGLICAWNEITEGAALLPRIQSDGTIDTSYIDAVRNVTRDLKQRNI